MRLDGHETRRNSQRQDRLRLAVMCSESGDYLMSSPAPTVDVTVQRLPPCRSLIFGPLKVWTGASVLFPTRAARFTDSAVPRRSPKLGPSADPSYLKGLVTGRNPDSATPLLAPGPGAPFTAHAATAGLVPTRRVLQRELDSRAAGAQSASLD